MKFVDKKYNFLKPIRTPNLVRLGRTHDGAYVVDSEIIKQCNILITFGLGFDWSFELDYMKKNKEIEYESINHNDKVSKEFCTSTETQHALIFRNSICFKIKLISISIASVIVINLLYNF